MKQVTYYLTKDYKHTTKVWSSKPKFNRDTRNWEGSRKNVKCSIVTGQTITDQVKPGQCKVLYTFIGSPIYDYDKTPEGKLLNAVFGKE